MHAFSPFLGIVLVASAAAQPPSEPQKLKALLDSHWEEWLQRHPFEATRYGDDRYNDRFLNEISPEWRKEERLLLAKWLSAFNALNRNKLNGQDRLTRDIMVRDLEESLAALGFPSHLLPIDQAGSAVAGFAMLGSGEVIQPFRDAKDYWAWLKRAEGFIAWMDQAIVNMKEGMTKGVVQPKVLMAKVLPQVDAVLAEDPERSVFWGPIKALPKTSIPPEERAALTAAYRKAITERINPAYRRLRDFLAKTYLPACRETVGYGQLPDGQAWYAHRVKVMTTTDLDPETIHQTGLREVKRILGEMETVKTQVGFKGDLRAFFQSLGSDPRFYYTRPEDLLQGYRDLQKKIDGRLPRLFDVFPKSNYEVRPVEAFRAEGAPAAFYFPGSAEGKRSGIFYVNTLDLKTQPKFCMETLSLHEASPGHHFQTSLAQELENLPAIRRFANYTAYVEGWALYAESLGKELGLFTDPYQWYGRLSEEQLRAMRLVVDTGIHAKGWTRDQAIKFMRENSSMVESDVLSEVDRYIAWPGQALGYKLGQFAIRELRDEAEAALGKRFDLRAFHRQVLIDGALPLDVLKTKIRQNVFDDFIGCAQFLIQKGYTSREKLAIEGGSNGGLLMGAVLVQRPELFSAVVSFVGMYDMLRVELTANGAFNVTEFGTVKDPDQFKALHAYSPYHHVKDGTAYPPVLFTTGEHDGRVDPWMSYKMTARLQAAGGPNPVLLRVASDAGHGMGTSQASILEEDTDVYTFLFHYLGMR